MIFFFSFYKFGHLIKSKKGMMYSLSLIFIFSVLLTFVSGYPITYENFRGTPYKVGYDHRSITINGVRTMLISGAIHYPRSTPQAWPYLMKMAKNQGLNTIQTYAFWNLHEQTQGILDFSGRANLSQFLQIASDVGLFVNLRIGPYICGEWNYGGLPAWINKIANISIRSSNDPWKSIMKEFMVNLLSHIEPYLAKNGGPVILSQIENEYHTNDQNYVQWCGDLVSNDLSQFDLVWLMCNGYAANSTIETCNSCNCLDDGWIDQHRRTIFNQPAMFTENEGWYQSWGKALSVRSTSDIAYAVAGWFAGGGAYHSYYMWHGGNNYEHTAGSGIATMYADDVCLHSDGTPNEPKYTQLSRLQHLIANYSQILLSQDGNKTLLPYWDGSKWTIGTQQFVYSYLSSIYFLINQAHISLAILFQNQNITMSPRSVRIYDEKFNMLYDTSNYTDISSNNTQLVTIVDAFQWKTWSESNQSNASIVSSATPIEQIAITDDQTIYLWYRRNVTLTEVSSHVQFTVPTRRGNSLLFYFDGKYLGEFNNHDEGLGNVQANLQFDLSNFQPNKQYLFEILSISFGLNAGVPAYNLDYKGIVGNISLNGQILVDQVNPWRHQKGLVGEEKQIYTEQGSTTVFWNSNSSQGFNKTITWFQSTFDLDHLQNQDTNANPLLFDAQGLNRGHVFINGFDIGLYWLIQGQCQSQPGWCTQSQTQCNQPTQRYYHIPTDWIKPTNNLITIFEHLGTNQLNSVRILQRIVKN